MTEGLKYEDFAEKLSKHGAVPRQGYLWQAQRKQNRTQAIERARQL